MFEQLGLIGCGLMGGSFAMALKKAGLVKRVVGYSKSPSTTERARAMGIIDIEAPSALLAVSGADIVLIAVPVSATETSFKAIKHLVTPEMLIMDVGSTKRDVIDAARRSLREHIGLFVPAHPIAGKESAGVEHADADLYLGKQVILTPIDRTLPAQLEKATELWRRLGCKVFPSKAYFFLLRPPAGLAAKNLYDELIERYVMKYLGLSYDDAHTEYAEPAERVIRAYLEA